jgi:hypothetical protein
VLSSNAIVEMHDQLTRAWHFPQGNTDPEIIPSPNRDKQKSVSDAEADFLAARGTAASRQLRSLAHRGRGPHAGATDAELADVKRRIDATNQLRNDLAEDLDRALMNWLAPQGLPNPEAPLHSESPGLMIDRLSIQALKIYHTCEECERPGRRGRACRAQSRSPLPFLKNSAPTWLCASMHSGEKRLQGPANSSFIGN